MALICCCALLMYVLWNVMTPIWSIFFFSDLCCSCIGLNAQGQRKRDCSNKGIYVTSSLVCHPNVTVNICSSLQQQQQLQQIKHCLTLEIDYCCASFEARKQLNNRHKSDLIQYQMGNGRRHAGVVPFTRYI